MKILDVSHVNFRTYRFKILAHRVSGIRVLGNRHGGCRDGQTLHASVDKFRDWQENTHSIISALE